MNYETGGGGDSRGNLIDRNKFRIYICISQVTKSPQTDGAGGRPKKINNQTPGE